MVKKKTSRRDVASSARQVRRDRAGAEAEYRAALRIAPRHAGAHWSLHLALLEARAGGSSRDGTCAP